MTKKILVVSGNRSFTVDQLLAVNRDYLVYRQGEIWRAWLQFAETAFDIVVVQTTFEHDSTDFEGINFADALIILSRKKLKEQVLVLFVEHTFDLALQRIPPENKIYAALNEVGLQEVVARVRKMLAD